MTVKELIEKLKTFNEDYEIVGPCKDGYEWFRVKCVNLILHKTMMKR